MNKLIKTLITLFVISISLYSCKESKTSTSTTTEKETVTVDPCDGITFAMVNTIIIDRCLGCHSGHRPDAGLDFNDKAVIMTTAKNGKLSCVLTDADCKKMPPYGDGLEESQIKLIKCWVDNGMKE